MWQTTVENCTKSTQQGLHHTELDDFTRHCIIRLQSAPDLVLNPPPPPISWKSHDHKHDHRYLPSDLPTMFTVFISCWWSTHGALPHGGQVQSLHWWVHRKIIAKVIADWSLTWFRCGCGILICPLAKRAQHLNHFPLGSCHTLAMEHVCCSLSEGFQTNKLYGVTHSLILTHTCVPALKLAETNKQAANISSSPPIYSLNISSVASPCQ